MSVKVEASLKHVLYYSEVSADNEYLEVMRWLS